ncbi:MAG: hypothetical protein ACI8RN_001142, partial [Glaciecola sp.]
MLNQKPALSVLFLGNSFSFADKFDPQGGGS